MALFHFLAEHEEDLRKQFLVTLDYYQHRDLYGSAAGVILRAGADRYCQAIREYINVPDPQIVFFLQCQIDGLLTLRMLHGTTISFVEQARPFIEMLVSHARNTAGAPETRSASSLEAEQRKER